VTHLAYLSAGGLSRVDELTRLKKDWIKDKGFNPTQSKEALDEFTRKLTMIYSRPLDIDSHILGVTPSHFMSYNIEAPLDDLLALRIPIFQAYGDHSSIVPRSSIEAISAAFEQAGKDNLECMIYPGLDHGFTGKDPDDPDSDRRFQMSRVFDDFCAWFSGA